MPGKHNYEFIRWGGLAKTVKEHGLEALANNDAFIEWQIMRSAYILLSSETDKAKRKLDLARLRVKYWSGAHEAAKKRLRETNRTRAIPSWSDKDDALAIKKLMSEARKKTKETGIKHSLDHIWPINADWVCGLHTSKNIRVITASENSAKRDRRNRIHCLIEATYKSCRGDNRWVL
jgi:hypothetical protein